MNKKFLKFCWIANIIVIVYMLIPFVFFNHYDSLSEILFLSPLSAIFYGLGILAMILWLYCIGNYKKVTDSSDEIFWLIFLSALYIPFHYYWYYLKKK